MLYNLELSLPYDVKKNGRNNRHELYYSVINNSERVLSYNSKKILANRSLQLINVTNDRRYKLQP